MDIKNSLVRSATIGDANDLAMIYASTWRTNWKDIFPDDYIDSMISRRNALWWGRNLKRGTTPPPLVYVVDDQPVAYISFGRSRYGVSGFEGEIYELNVKPEFQGRGVGTLLFEESRKTLETDELIGLLAWSLQVNERCCRFFESLGGRPWERSVVRFGTMGTIKEYARIAFVWPPYEQADDSS